MPTGYTDTIEKGISFRDFTLQCARAFGACVEMRDEPMSAEIPDEFKPGDYNSTARAVAKEKLVRLKAMTPLECEGAALCEFESQTESNSEYVAQKAALRKKYEAMLEDVEGWIPPTADHEGLKKFMVDQIEDSIDGDCGYIPSAPVQKTGPEWLAGEMQGVQRDIEYHENQQLAENKRAADRSTWVQELRASLPEG